MKANATPAKSESPGAAAAPPLDIAVDVASADWTAALDDPLKICERALAAAFAVAGRGRTRPAEVSLVLADDAMVAELNADYRGKDGPTNVLSFPQSDDEGPGAGGPADLPDLLGDVIIAFGVTRAEAAAQDLPLADHLSHLCVHGMLHLLGFDHLLDDEADRMERLETEILGGLGIPDPYGKER
jgi:probable rRNA maturation factor